MTATTCTTCTQPIAAETRAVVFTAAVAYCRPCWLAIVTRPVVTAVERRMGRAWTAHRCRLSA